MTNRSSVQTPSEFQTVTIQTNPIAVADRMRDVYQSLSRRAYDLFEGRLPVFRKQSTVINELASENSGCEEEEAWHPAAKMQWGSHPL